jgi:hypothetical protein
MDSQHGRSKGRGESPISLSHIRISPIATSFRRLTPNGQQDIQENLTTTL